MVGYIRALRTTLTTCGLLFITVSVIYTTNFIFFSPLSGLISGTFDWLALLPAPQPARDLSPASHAAFLASRSSGENRWTEPSRPVLSWISSQFTLQHGLGHDEAIPVNPGPLLSKGTVGPMGPSNVIPYFYRAKGSFDSDDITVTTLITSNRFKVFARLVEKYRGPISVTVHIKDIAEHVSEVLESLREVYTSSELMMTFVDVHLVVDAFDRQFNTWRNIARLFARTDFVMMLDIDFFPCTDFRSVIKRSSTILDKLHDGRAALVIPAFEYVDFHEGSNYAAFPTTKRDLLHLVQKQRIGMFHAFWGPGHNATDYKRFYNSSPGEVYKVTKYQSAYEPYIIFKKDGPPWCDERFVGYGGNKAACLFEMYLAGVSYYVLADHFIIHQNHLYEETVRIHERRYNRRLYADFKEETCLRYLKRYYDRGLLGSSLATNALAECRKIKTLARNVAKVMASYRYKPLRLS